MSQLRTFRGKLKQVHLKQCQVLIKELIEIFLFITVNIDLYLLLITVSITKSSVFCNLFHHLFCSQHCPF